MKHRKNLTLSEIAKNSAIQDMMQEVGLQEVELCLIEPQKFVRMLDEAIPKCISIDELSEADLIRNYSDRYNGISILKNHMSRPKSKKVNGLEQSQLYESQLYNMNRAEHLKSLMTKTTVDKLKIGDYVKMNKMSHLSIGVIDKLTKLDNGDIEFVMTCIVRHLPICSFKHYYGELKVVVSGDDLEIDFFDGSFISRSIMLKI